VLTADQLLLTLWRRRATFFITFILVMVAVAVVTYTRPKVYAATAYILVGSTKASGSDFEATQTNQVVLKTYSELLQTRSVSIEVAKALPFPMTPDGIEAAVSVAPISQSQLVQITAEAGEPGRAQTLANAYADVFVERAGTLSAGTGGTISSTVADRAARDDRPIQPRPKLYLAIGALLAALLAAGVAILRDRSDQHLDIDESATDLYGLPILARLPEQSPSALRDLVRLRGADTQHNLLNESFDLLLTNIVFASLGTTKTETIAVVSSGESEGKSTCCVGLARAAASHDLDVLLVDGDLRRRRLTSMLGLENKAQRGFAQVLADGPASWSSAALGTEMSSSLRALPAGKPVAQPAALLSASVPAFERWAAKAYSVVVFDTPPVNVGADASLIAAAVEEVLLVVNVRTAKRSALEQTIEQLHRVQANIIGVVLNHTDPSTGPKDYYGDLRPADPSGDGER